MLMITQYHSIYPGLVTQTGNYHGDQEQDNISKMIYPGLFTQSGHYHGDQEQDNADTLLMMMNRSHEYV